MKGEQEWRQGRTENMSRSGVLFTSDDPLSPEADVEMVFVLPVSAQGDGASVVTCQGRVVRTAFEAAALPRMAATFLTYQFLRPAAVEEG
jgi:PilZ domain-containing protein